MNKDTLMILGAGQCQVPIIKQAQKMGFEVITVSIAGKYPGFSIAEKFYEVDVREKEKILEIARQEEICGILTDQTDIPVPTVAYVAEEMGLPGITYNCALRFTDKYIMRQVCQQIDIPVPKHFQALSLGEAHKRAKQLGFPLILKPVDSQGSRGVMKVNSADELGAKFQNALHYSASSRVILEEFFFGREVVVQGFVSNYEFLNLAIGDREYFSLPDLFIPKQTLFPSLLREDLKQKVLLLNSQLIMSFAPKFGLTHSEFLVDEVTGEIRLVETAIRGGGVFISSHLVPLASGININKLLIQMVTGENNIRIERNNLQSRSAGYLCFYLPQGTIQQVHGVEEITSVPGVHEAHLKYLQKGTRVVPISDKTMRLGPILIAGNDRKALEETITKIKKTLIIEVSTQNGVKGIQW